MVCLQPIMASCRCGCCFKSPSSPWDWETSHPFQAERKCQGEGLLGCSGRQDGWVGPLHEQASQAATEDIRHSKEPSEMAGRKPNLGAFSVSLPPGTYWQGWEPGQQWPPAFLSLVNTWKSTLFYRMCDHSCDPVLASGAHFFQEVWSTAASYPVLTTVPRQHSPRAWNGGQFLWVGTLAAPGNPVPPGEGVPDHGGDAHFDRDPCGCSCSKGHLKLGSPLPVICLSQTGQ